MESQTVRIKKIVPELERLYPDTTIALHFRNPFELLTATILSAQCTDEVVNRVTPPLFARYPTPEKLAAAKPAEVEQLVHATGFFRNKAKNIMGMAREVAGRFGGRVPDSMEALLTLPGVARKTANVVLGTVFHKAEGVVVDTHVRRISGRLGLTTESDPGKIEQDLMQLVPRKEWHPFAIRLIFHGRKVCVARNPKCEICTLALLCPGAFKYSAARGRNNK